MDAAMPIRDGIEATAEITAADPAANVIVCADAGREDRMEAAVEAGADGYLTKPFQKPSVISAIEDIVPA
jgi:two-component system chemotaxis response regulator CheY